MQGAAVEQEKGYNGWKNYETWVTALWIDNDQGSYQESRALARLARENRNEGTENIAEEHRDAAMRAAFADELKSWVEEVFIPDLDASLAADLLGAALSDVDWFEIAENYLSESE